MSKQRFGSVAEIKLGHHPSPGGFDTANWFVEECITGAAGRSKPTGVSYDEIHAFSKKLDQGNGSRCYDAYVAVTDGGRKGYAAALVAGQWNAAGERRNAKDRLRNRCAQRRHG
jgi:hypothetical protein